MPSFDQRNQIVNSQININIESQGILEKQITYDSVMKSCEAQVNNEINTILDTKYIPEIYIDRNIDSRILSFINKSNQEGKAFIEKSIELVDEEIDALQNRLAEIKNAELEGRFSFQNSSSEKIESQMKNSLSSMKSIRPYLEHLKDTLDLDNISLKEIKKEIQEIRKKPGCINSILVQLTMFEKFLNNTLVIKDMAGRGKTNLMCALAKSQVESRPTVLVLAGSIRLSDKLDLENFIQKSLGIPEQGNNSNFLSKLVNFSSSKNKGMLIIVDAINENRNTELLKSAIESLITKYRDCDIKFIFTCRDIYWDGFLHTSGDFWDTSIFDLLSLGDFSENEFNIVFPLYLKFFRINATLSELSLKKLRHPLLLRFFCEAYKNSESSNSVISIEDIRLKGLFDVYWTKKIISSKESLGLRSARNIEDYLCLIARKMRFIRDRSLSIAEIAKITKIDDFDTKESIFTSILDEGIILEHSPLGMDDFREPRITFVYDEFMEYVIAKDILRNNILSDSPEKMKYKLERIVDSARRFNSMVGVITYLLPMLEENGRSECWRQLFLQGATWDSCIVNALNKVFPDRLSPQAMKTALLIMKRCDLQIKKRILEIAESCQTTFPEDCLSLCGELYFDSHKEINIKAKDCLINLYYLGHKKEVVGFFEESLSSKRRNSIGMSIYALAAIGEFDIKKILPFVCHQDGFIREAAIYSLCKLYKITDEKTLSWILSKGLSDPVFQIRKTTISMIKDEGINKVLPKLSIFVHNKKNKQRLSIRR